MHHTTNVFLSKQLIGSQVGLYPYHLKEKCSLVTRDEVSHKILTIIISQVNSVSQGPLVGPTTPKNDVNKKIRT